MSVDGGLHIAGANFHVASKLVSNFLLKEFNEFYRSFELV